MAQVEPLACAPGYPSILTFKEVCWAEWGLTLVTTFCADISIPKPTVLPSLTGFWACWNFPESLTANKA